MMISVRWRGRIKPAVRRLLVVDRSISKKVANGVQRVFIGGEFLIAN